MSRSPAGGAIRVAALLALGVSAAFAARSEDVPVRYTLELLDPLETLVGVRVEVAGDLDGSSEFSLSEGWAGIADAAKDLELVEARGAGDALETERLAPYRWRVTHAPGEPLALVFEFRPTRHRASTGPPEYYLPILEPGLLHAIGTQTLPSPEHLDGGRARPIKLAWSGFAEAGWRTISSFGVEGELRTTFPLDAFRHALFLAGNLRLAERKVAGQSLWIALHGAWKFRDEDFVDLAERIVAMERGFFADHSRAHYLISLIPVGGGAGSSWGGTGLTNSFALFMTGDNALRADEGVAGVA